MEDVTLVTTNIVLIFIVILSFVFIVLFTFRPPFFQKIKRGFLEPENDAQGDPVKCFVGSIIISLFVVFIAWMIHICTNQKILASSSNKVNASNIFIIFLIVFSAIYIVFFTFRPKIFLYVEKGQYEANKRSPIDPAKCFVGALILSLCVVLIIWMFKSS